LKQIKESEYRPPKPTPRFSPPEKIDIKLPMTGEELFGRQKELEMLIKPGIQKTHISSAL